MTDERLYIDGVLVDTDEDTKITMDIKSNLFRDVSKIASNTTYTVKLPKTVRNQMLLRHSDLVQSNQDFPYQMHTSRYFRNGVEVIKEGRASVLAVTSEAIEVSIVWGLYPNFSNLLSKGTTLDQLESNDKILFQSSNTPSDYTTALTEDYFYAIFDMIVHEVTVNYDWRGSSGMSYPEGGGRNFGSSSTSTGSISFGGSHSTTTTYGAYHPVVKAAWVLKLIKEKVGVDFKFAGTAKEYLDTLVIPLINKKSNELTFGSQFEATAAATTNVGVVPLTIGVASNVFSGDAGSTVQELVAVSDANVLLDFNGEWQFDITGARPNGHSSTTVNGVTSTTDRYSFRGLYWLRFRVLDAKGNEVAVYNMGDYRNSYMSVSVPGGYQGVVKFTSKGYGKLELKKGQKVVLEWAHSGGGLKGVQFNGGTLKATLSSDEYVPSGGYFPIAYNLPKIKIIEFVKFLSVITGTFPLQMSKDNVVEFVPLSTVWNNKKEAKDWTRRVIAQKAENKPSSLEFKMSDYAQHNYYKWKEDDKVSGNYDGDIQIANDTLETERTIYTFPFSACDGNNVPMYTPAKTTSGGGGSFGSGSSSSSDSSTDTESTEPDYNACNDRILRLTKDENGKATLMFDINMQNIIDEKYAEVVQTLQNAKIVKEKMRIRDLELLDFDETKPIFLAQYGCYFAVTEIKADTNGLADVTMLQLSIR